MPYYRCGTMDNNNYSLLKQLKAPECHVKRAQVCKRSEAIRVARETEKKIMREYISLEDNRNGTREKKHVIEYEQSQIKL